VFEYQALANHLEEKHLKLNRALHQKLQLERMKVERYRLKMSYLHPRTQLQKKQQLSVEIEEKLRLSMDKKLNLAKQKLAIRIERMKGLSPLAKLNQGFSYVASEEGTVVKSIAHVKPHDLLSIFVTDGIIKTKVEDTYKGGLQ